MKRLLSIFSLLLVVSFLWAQEVPEGYYSSAEGKTNKELKTALHQIIEVGTRLTYGSGQGRTWSGFEKSDLHPDGYVWDMYSMNKYYFPGNGGVPSGMNIEHSVAKSWWGGTNNNAYKDLYHLNPSNSTANSARSNYPLGVNNGSKFDNQSIKVGNNTFGSEYAGYCFEPLDEYKGDFARAYMYMFTCYEDFDWSGTNGPTMLVKSETWPMLKNWARDLLLQWHRQDPVSQKEIVRQQEIFKIQQNRNPFIDYPELVEYIWGAKQGEPFYPGGGSDMPYLQSPYNNSARNYGNVAVDGEYRDTIRVKGANLEGDVTFALTGSDVAYFTLSVAQVPASSVNAGFDLIVTCRPVDTKEYAAVLTISGANFSNPTLVALNAKGVNEFVALPAANITLTSFDARWTRDIGASSYSLNVYTLEQTGEEGEKVIVEEPFTTGFPGSWVSTGYKEVKDGALRMSSGSQACAITMPSLDLSKSGSYLFIRAKQYGNDSGAPITVKVDDVVVETIKTGTDYNGYTISVSGGAEGKISISTEAGKRVYVDSLSVVSKGAVASKVSINGYPRNVGSVLSYTVEGVDDTVVFYYEVTSENVEPKTTNAVAVKTSITSDVEQPEASQVIYFVRDGELHVRGLEQHAVVKLYNVTGQYISSVNSVANEAIVTLPSQSHFIIAVIESATSRQAIKLIY